jgi:hypothetical protein
MITELNSMFLWILNANISVEKVKLQLILCYGTVMSMNTKLLSESGNAIDLIPRIVAVCKITDSIGLKNACLFALNNATSKFYTQLSEQEAFQDLSWMIDLYFVSSLDFKQLVLGVIRNTSIACCTGYNFLNVRRFVKLALDTMAREVSLVVATKELERNIKIHALSILCNMSVHDETAQLVCTMGGALLFTQLMSILEAHNSKEEKRVVLFCFRNLTIDLKTCSTILVVVAPKFVHMLIDGNNTFRLECLQILHNLLILSEEAFTYLYQCDGFLAEVIECARTPNPPLQSCAIDIISHLISLGKAS